MPHATELEGRLREVETSAPGGPGVTDHGALTGLADDDHAQYHTDARGDARYSLLAHSHSGVYEPTGTAAAVVSAHAALADPHPVYLTAVEANALYALAAAGVTNGNTHDHNGGDGAQIAYGTLSGLPTLGGASSLNVGTTAGTVAAGDHLHTGVYAAAGHSHAGLAPAGGASGQVLKKNSATDYDYAWAADSTGGGGSAAFTAFERDLGAGRTSGTFDLTGLSGLTTDKIVSIQQTAAPIASKGNARDEAEFDTITLSAYVLNATTIRAFWRATGVVVGSYAFGFMVSA